MCQIWWVEAALWYGHVQLLMQHAHCCFSLHLAAAEMNVCICILSAEIQTNDTEVVGHCFTVQMDNDPEHTEKRQRN